MVKAFHDAVDDYLELCEQAGKEPLKSFKGTFNVRINPDLHRQAYLLASAKHMSLNQLVQEAIEREVKLLS